MAAPIKGLTKAARRRGFTGGGYIPTSQIRWRLGNIHVSTSALEIAREFWFQRARRLPRPLRRAVVRYALKCHEANRALYVAVMTGRF